MKNAAFYASDIPRQLNDETYVSSASFFAVKVSSLQVQTWGVALFALQGF
jgi:hypothetical protein